VSLKKLLKKVTPRTDKLTPQFVKKSETLSNLSNANIAFSNMKFAEKVADAPSLKPKDIRPLLREKHELNTTPGSKTSKLIYRRDQLPEGDPERERLTAQINAATLRRGKVGIAVGGTVVGGAAGAAIKAGGSAATRENPTPDNHPENPVDTWPDPRSAPEIEKQMYARRPAGVPLANQRGLDMRAPNGGGVISKVVNVLWSILVPKKQPVSAPRAKADFRLPGTGGFVKPGSYFDETGRWFRVF